MVSSLFSSIYMISKFKTDLSVDVNLALMYEKENVIFLPAWSGLSHQEW